MAHVIFVHGMRAKAGSWMDVPKGVEAAGHTISNETLPGHNGGRELLLTTMRSYIRSVVGQFPNTGKVILVGHSMGGAVISEVAADHADRVEKLIYVAAMLPKHGDSIAGLMLEAGSTIEDVEKEFEDAGVSLSGPLMGKQPPAPLFATFDTSAGFEALPRHFIRCQDDKVLPLAFQNDMIDRAKGTTVTTSDINSGHIPQASKPDKLLDQILQEIP